MEFVSRNNKERVRKLKDEIGRLQKELVELEALENKHKHKEEIIFEYIKNSTADIKRNKLNIYAPPCRQNIIVKRVDNKIICELKGKNSVARGVARCNPEDDFNYQDGITLAMQRAYFELYKTYLQKTELKLQ